MRVFPAELEERAFRHARVREWKDSGLVSAESAARIGVEIGEAPARAAWPLRVVLFGFSGLCLSAGIGLFAVAIRDRAGIGVVCLAWAGIAVAAAETLIRSLKAYRQGAEEALAAAAVVLCAFGAERLLGGGGQSWKFSTEIFSAALAAAAALAYARYGYRLAAIGVAVGLGVFVSSFSGSENAARVELAALYAVLLAAVTFWPDLPRRERERLEIARFFLALSVPLCLNLKLERVAGGYALGGAGQDAFAWATFAAIFLIPAAVLAWGVSSRARALLWAGGIGFLIALCSVKPYLGLPRNSWDPAVLGAGLIAAALILKRRLDSGPDGRRGAYSSWDLGGARDGGALGLLAGVVAAAPAAAPAGPAAPQGRGGGFGGGGASGHF